MEPLPPKQIGGKQIKSGGTAECRPGDGTERTPGRALYRTRIRIRFLDPTPKPAFLPTKSSSTLTEQKRFLLLPPTNRTLHCLHRERERERGRKVKRRKMEGQEGQKQEPHLALADNLFLLTHPDVPDIEKIRLKDDVLASIKADGKTNLSSSDSTLPFHPLFTKMPSSSSSSVQTWLRSTKP